MKARKVSDYRGVVLIVGLALAMSVGVVGYAYTSQYAAQNVIESAENVTISGGQGGEFGAATFIAEPTTFTDIKVQNDALFEGDTEFDSSLQLDATTTVQQVVLGSRFSGALTFTAGATTTPGGLFAIQNTGSPKLCGTVQLSITSGSALGGPDGAGDGLVFAIATSTSATNLSSGLQSLMASTTVATGTAPVIGSIVNPGSYVGGDQDIGGASWRWDNGVYVIGTFDEQTLSADGSAYATSSDIYTSMAGKYYINCISE